MVVGLIDRRSTPRFSRERVVCGAIATAQLVPVVVCAAADRPFIFSVRAKIAKPFVAPRLAPTRSADAAFVDFRLATNAVA